MDSRAPGEVRVLLVVFRQKTGFRKGSEKAKAQGRNLSVALMTFMEDTDTCVVS